MPTFNFSFYENDPKANGFASIGTFTYTGPTTYFGTAAITDNQTGVDGEALDENGETATADIDLGATTYTDVVVIANEAWLIRDDVTGDQFHAIDFEARTVVDGTLHFTLSEIPLIAGRSYTILDRDSAPEATDNDPAFFYANYVCFAPGALIKTPTGDKAVETLRVGDLVDTMDRGPQPLIWTGARHLRMTGANNDQRPIEIKHNAFGPGLPNRPLVLSPQHRVLFETGREELLGPVKGFLDCPHVRSMTGRTQVTYHTIMTPTHSVVFANGLPVETLWPGTQALSVLKSFERLTLIGMFPKLLDDAQTAYGPPARRLVKRKEVMRAVQTKGFRIPMPANSSNNVFEDIVA